MFGFFALQIPHLATVTTSHAPIVGDFIKTFESFNWLKCFQN